MKLKELRTVLADSIEKYSVTLLKQHEEVVYELDYTKLDGASRLALELTGDPVADELDDVEVKSVYVGDSGFIIELANTNTVNKLTQYADYFKVPLTTTVYKLTDEDVDEDYERSWEPVEDEEEEDCSFVN